MQVGCGILDVDMLILAGAAFRRQHATAVDVMEIAIGELIPPLGMFALLFVEAQIPFAVFAIAMLIDELVLIVGSRLVLAPVVPLVEHEPSGDDKRLGVFKRCPV